MPKGMDPRPGVFRVICRDCIDTIKQAQSRAQVFESFDGITFDPEQDAERLGEQMCRVLTVCLDDNWHTLSELSEKTGDPESSISARLRDVRKKWGKAAMQSKRLKEGKGTWIYKVHVRRAA
jgi:DNA-directed RNA polymerase specialized sigma24 family protein